MFGLESSTLFDVRFDVAIYNRAVKDLPQRLERYRQENGLTKTEMGALFGVEYQVYYSWIIRNSIPKKHLSRAGIILKHSERLSSLDIELLERFSRLPDEKAKIILEMIDGILEDR